MDTFVSDATEWMISLHLYDLFGSGAPFYTSIPITGAARKQRLRSALSVFIHQYSRLHISKRTGSRVTGQVAFDMSIPPRLHILQDLRFDHSSMGTGCHRQRLSVVRYEQ